MTHVSPYATVDAPNYWGRVPVDTTSLYRVRALQLRNLHSFLHSEPPGIRRCTQRA